MSELFIDGEWAAGTGPAFASRNPGTGATVWEGHSASADDVDHAVRSARRAFATRVLPLVRRFAGGSQRLRTHLLEPAIRAIVCRLGFRRGHPDGGSPPGVRVRSRG